MAERRGRVSLAVLCAVLVFLEKTTGQNIATNQITQSSNINTDNVNYNANQKGFNVGVSAANFIPSVVNSGLPQGVQTVSSVQQANVQQASNNFNPYAGSSTSTAVTEQSISSGSPGIISPSGFSNIQASNIAGSSQQQYQNINQNSAISQVQTGQNGQSLSTTSNQVTISNNQNTLPSYQNLPLNSYPFGGNFEIPLNLEVSLPPVSIGVSDKLGPVVTQPSSTTVQQPYNSNPCSSFPYLPIPYSTGVCSRSGIRDLWPIFLVALCNNNGGRCGCGQGGGCGNGRSGGSGNGCNNCIPVPVPIPIPFNPVIVKCGGESSEEEEEEEETERKPKRKS